MTQRPGASAKRKPCPARRSANVVHAALLVRSANHLDDRVRPAHVYVLVRRECNVVVRAATEGDLLLQLSEGHTSAYPARSGMLPKCVLALGTPASNYISKETYYCPLLSKLRRRVLGPFRCLVI